jgi:hypothetical protein
MEGAMALDVEGFFSGLAMHLRKRSKDIAEIATMAAIEHWVQFEAATLLTRRGSREKYGIGGGTLKTPTWWVVCEHKKIDLYITGPQSPHAIEFKAIHNNKNFYSKVREARHDLNKKLDPEVGQPHRTVFAIVTHVLYEAGAKYVPLRESPRGKKVEAGRFKELLTTELASNRQFYKGCSPTRIVRWEQITSLDEAPYAIPQMGSFVELALIKPAEVSQHGR